MSQIAPSGIVRQKQPRIKDEDHLVRIRMCDCIVCGASFPSEAAHIRYPDAKYGKFITGMAEKPNDMWNATIMRNPSQGRGRCTT